MQILVTGLGRFGSSLARTLAESGHEVIVLDTSEQAIQIATDVVDQAVVGDATNEAVLREVGATDVDLAVVAMAEVEASVLITTHLKNLRVPRVFAKASSEVHRLIWSVWERTAWCFPSATWRCGWPKACPRPACWTTWNCCRTSESRR